MGHKLTTRGEKNCSFAILVGPKWTGVVAVEICPTERALHPPSDGSSLLYQFKGYSVIKRTSSNEVPKSLRYVAWRILKLSFFAGPLCTT